MQKGTKNKDDVRYRLRGWSFFKKKLNIILLLPLKLKYLLTIKVILNFMIKSSDKIALGLQYATLGPHA